MEKLNNIINELTTQSVSLDTITEIKRWNTNPTSISYEYETTFTSNGVTYFITVSSDFRSYKFSKGGKRMRFMIDTAEITEALKNCSTPESSDFDTVYQNVMSNVMKLMNDVGFID